VLNGFSSETLSIQNKITFYPIIEGAYVNTKNWYRKKTDLWAEFGKEMPFDRKNSSKDSVEILAVGNTPSFGRRTVYAKKRKFSGIRDDVAWI
jgi:hypothetical protein